MKELIKETEGFIGLRLSEQQVARLQAYADELSEWNQRFSLTAISDPEKIRIKHFLDSFTPYLVMKNLSGRRVIDIGTGAGFPGIPLKILLPEIEVILVDSIGKKTAFCEHIVRHLGLEGIQVVRERVERLGQDQAFREQFDWAIARAVAHLSTLSEYLLPLVKVNGKMLAMKGAQGPQEAQEAENALSMLGGDLQQVQEIKLPGVVEHRYLITILKKASTPDKYPRRVGIPGKRPL